MFEYEIIQIVRNKEKKTREVTNKKGKIDTEVYTEIEPIENFHARAKKILNDLANQGWEVINTTYSLPVVGCSGFMAGGGAYGYSATDFDSAEFVVVLQRNKK